MIEIGSIVFLGQLMGFDYVYIFIIIDQSVNVEDLNDLRDKISVIINVSGVINIMGEIVEVQDLYDVNIVGDIVGLGNEVVIFEDIVIEVLVLIVFNFEMSGMINVNSV